MTDDKIILKLIETASPDDTAKLDEIDARVWCWLNGYDFLEFGFGGQTFRARHSSRVIHTPIPYKYTRSRDALKAIRPAGKVSWVFFNNYPEGSTARAEIFHDQGDNLIQTGWLPTEELAELHTIIQAIAYERGQS